MGYTFHTRTRGRSVTSVQHHTLPEKVCDFCTTFIPLPDSSVTSVTNLIPYRKYPYPTEHNLEISHLGHPQMDRRTGYQPNCKFRGSFSETTTLLVFAGGGKAVMKQQIWKAIASFLLLIVTLYYFVEINHEVRGRVYS